MSEQVQEVNGTNDVVQLPPPPDALVPEVRDAIADVKPVALPDTMDLVDAARLEALVVKDRLCNSQIQALQQQIQNVQAEQQKYKAKITELAGKYQMPLDGSCTFNEETGKITRRGPQVVPQGQA